MNRSIVAIVILSSTAFLSGCAGEVANNDVSYDSYEPGYTGYTVGYGAYGIPNGYDPSYWNPGYFNNMGVSRGSVGYAYYGGRR